MSLIYSYKTYYSNPVSFPSKQIHNNARIDNVKNAMPSKFYPTDTSSVFSMARNTFTRKSETNWNNPLFSTSHNDSSNVTQRRRLHAIGYSSMKSPASLESLSFKYQHTSEVNQALKRIRSGGTVPPRKKGYV